MVESAKKIKEFTERFLKPTKEDSPDTGGSGDSNELKTETDGRSCSSVETEEKRKSLKRMKDKDEGYVHLTDTESPHRSKTVTIEVPDYTPTDGLLGTSC